MPGGGEIYLETQNVVLDRCYVEPYDLEPGNYVKLSVTDTGVGMDEETQQRIFDPFFTTKEMSRGTGLGLASAYGIIRNHGGILSVYSEKGEGTTFEIYLPACEKQAIKEKRFDEDVLEGTETILLVDDEDMIIDVGKQMLSRLGYKVLVARSGREAIEIISKTHKLSSSPDLVVLDMIMPDMCGGETFDRIKAINPDVKVLLSSGYSINSQARAILERGCDGFIQKPFNIKQLSQRSREILDKESKT
jgi:CheY-like chemotaxis protein